MGAIDQLILQLFDIEAFKFGSFKLKSGIQSPIYIDLRVIISYPDILRSVANHMNNILQNSNVSFNEICGVPYTALPIASIICVDYKRPMLLRRKEAKNYGTKKIIEGKFRPNDRCIIIEDIVTTGSSVIETAESLWAEGLQVTDAIVLIDREQHGEKNLQEKNIRLHRVLKISEVLDCLVRHGKITEEVSKNVSEFIHGNQMQLPTLKIEIEDKNISIPIRQRFQTIIKEKKSNLCLSADLTSLDEIIELSNLIGKNICMLKIHCDILTDFSMDKIQELKDVSRRLNFLLLEDRKFADIGNTVALQYTKGLFQIAEWADLVTVHVLPGEGIVQALEQAAQTINESRGCLLIAQMSSKGALTNNEDYVNGVIKCAEKYSDFVIGFISQSRLTTSDKYLHCTPGVHLTNTGDQLGQQYVTPRQAIDGRGADIVIVGRAILDSINRVKTAEAYQQECYQVYEELRKI
ncbi:unnamed protein product [Rotaria sordida]|uniref:Uridine 5'-monophosphate synthase n=1 Tax=Rotaria sordida TaxID=392033 RepID=A0A818LM26_9BILA|nr:unnamed protein product [Rotaria sordida]CAF0737286.1 unnamed protein product [Rotaria sordida]CAF0747037.1 unnamed protein product [Rotaria sordida]CAF0786228.1 unnamed protein product [Rotaria sordida]CAF0823572.1 unnamed protein product [Rotaria sordida]